MKDEDLWPSVQYQQDSPGPDEKHTGATCTRQPTFHRLEEVPHHLSSSSNEALAMMASKYFKCSFRSCALLANV